METILINLGLTALIELITYEIPADGSKKGKWRAALLKLFRLIAGVYGADPEFRAAMEKALKTKPPVK